MTITVQFSLEAASYYLTGSSKQDGIIHELRMIDVFSASSHPDAYKLLILPKKFQLKAENRGLHGVKQRGKWETLPQTSCRLKEGGSATVN